MSIQGIKTFGDIFFNGALRGVGNGVKGCNLFKGLSKLIFCFHGLNFPVSGFPRFPSVKKLSFLIIPAVIINFAFISDVYAGDDFAMKYRTYQSAVRAGRTFFNKRDYQKSISHYSTAIELSPFEVDLYSNRGIALYKTGKAKEAIEDFDKALAMDSRQYSAYVYRGLCREKTGEYIEALKDYSSALGMNPKDASIHNNLAWLYATAKDEKVQDKAKALEHAKKAAEISRERNAEILDTLARAYFMNGMNKEAVEVEKKALKLKPDNEGFKEKLKDYKKVLSSEY